MSVPMIMMTQLMMRCPLCHLGDAWDSNDVGEPYKSDSDSKSDDGMPPLIDPSDSDSGYSTHGSLILTDSLTTHKYTIYEYNNVVLNENPFIDNFVLIGAPRTADEINVLNAFQARQQEMAGNVTNVPTGHNANLIIIENFVKNSEAVPIAPINVNPSIEGRTLTEKLPDNGDHMNAKQ
ncbi:hypothetical protein C8J56DRAFT_890013 [Mycena floridula]|nr:hypothetical protein C8J56DRAFT_890013 [Mycena floridula]